MIVRELEASELKEAARLLARGMRDNPAHIAVFGPNADQRKRALSRLFLPALQGLYRRGTILGAFEYDVLVGVCGMAPPGRCRPGAIDKLRVLPHVLIGNPPAVLVRVLRWVSEWARLDPADPHWHLGPVAVDAHLQGQGIGSALLSAFGDRMDASATRAYLETDRPENVRFYEKFGFCVVSQHMVLDVPNWFMIRLPRGAAALHQPGAERMIQLR